MCENGVGAVHQWRDGLRNLRFQIMRLKMTEVFLGGGSNRGVCFSRCFPGQVRFRAHGIKRMAEGARLELLPFGGAVRRWRDGSRNRRCQSTRFTMTRGREQSGSSFPRCFHLAGSAKRMTKGARLEPLLIFLERGGRGAAQQWRDALRNRRFQSTILR